MAGSATSLGPGATGNDLTLSGPLSGTYVTTTGAAPGGTGTSPVTIGSRSSTIGAVWFNITPAAATDTNYSLMGNATDSTYIQAPGPGGSVYVVVNGSIKATLDGNGVASTGKLSGTNGATCNLDGGSPAKCDVTVTAGAKCLCTPVGASAAIAAGGCAVSLSSTTLTATSANTLTNAVNIYCDK